MKTYAVTFLVALASVASAHPTNIPSCALDCFLAPFKSDECKSLDDFKCRCEKSDSLFASVTPCVQAACSADDQQKTIAAIEEKCKQASASSGAASTPVRRAQRRNTSRNTKRINRIFDTPTEKYDAIVVGASMAGLVAATALTARGYKTALLDALPEVGGRVATNSTFLEYNFPLGVRDAVNGIGDVSASGLLKASRAAEASAVVRVHTLPEERIRDVSMGDITANSGANGTDPMATFRRLVQAFGPDDADVEATAAEVARLNGLMTNHTVEEAWPLVPVRVGDWLTLMTDDLDARTVIINQLEASHASPGEEASLGRFILSALGVDTGAHDFPPLVDLDEKELKGVNPFHAEALQWLKTFEANGGHSYLGWQPARITVEQGSTAGFGSGRRARVTGVVARNEANILRELRAPIVITDYFGWHLKDLVDERLLPTSFIEAAEATEAFSGDVISWMCGTTRLPKVRATGEVEDFSGWQRVSYGEGPIKSYHGGFVWLTMHDTNWAPEGRQLLDVSIAHQGRFRDWEEAKAAIEISRQYLSRYYEDLDEVTEFSAYHWVQEPQVLTWHLKPVYRHPVKVSTIEGLYVGSSSAEGMAGWIQQEAFAALQAVRLADKEIGRTLSQN